MAGVKKRAAKRRAEAAAVVAANPKYRAALEQLLEEACAELRRRIALRAGDSGRLDSLELIGTVKTAASLLVEADALLGEAPPK